MQAAGTAIGRTVRVAGPHGSMELRVVGQVVVPDAGLAPGLSEGAGMTLRGLRTIFPDAPANAFPIRFRPGVSVARELASLTPRLPSGATSDPPNRGATLAALVRVKELPGVIAANSRPAINRPGNSYLRVVEIHQTFRPRNSERLAIDHSDVASIPFALL